MKSPLIAAAMIALMAMPAAAACKQSDAEGKWRLFYNGHDDLQKTDWARCTIKIRKNGNVSTKSFCIFSDGEKRKVKPGGNIKVDRKCRFIGTFVAGPLTETTVDGQTSRDKNSVAGVGFDEEGRWTFVGYKR